jgi:integrase
MKFLKKIGPGEFSYELVHSKTNQSGTDRPENHKPVRGAAGAALQDWLAASRIHEGALFRRVLKGGKLGAPLSAAAVRDIVTGRCQLAGIEGQYSAHSLRSGFVTEAVQQQVPLPETMSMTGHRSVASVVVYARRFGGSRSKADNLGADL